jgi:PKHD-type hydroxylase
LSRAVQIEQALQPQQIRRILSAIKSVDPSWWDQSDLSSHFRSANAYWIERTHGTEWLFDQIETVFHTANKQLRYDISCICEPIFVAEYSLNDHFNWHTDTGGRQCANRQLSVSIALSELDEYSGGELDFKDLDTATLPFAAGNAIVFPSDTEHRVKKITSGTRRSLVAFMNGSIQT